jgi:hypothetical protein
MVSPYDDLVNQQGKKYDKLLKNAKKGVKIDKCVNCTLVSRDCPEKCKKPS